MNSVYVGTAAWSVPKGLSDRFPSEGMQLQRYSAVFPAVEVNTSFYRHHKAMTYARWATQVPGDFRFSIKLSQEFTHEQRLEVDSWRLRDVLAGIRELGDRWGPLLVQLPPSLAYDPRVATRFFAELRNLYSGDLALEPRHRSWFDDGPYRLLEMNDCCLVKADPDLGHKNLPRTSRRLSYFRLHGSPVLYESRYSPEFLQQLQSDIQKESAFCDRVYCIFDNTKYGWATTNAWEMQQVLLTPGDDGKLYAKPTRHRPLESL
jgi:uncharacterized protein YecE (DUF72 family)